MFPKASAVEGSRLLDDFLRKKQHSGARPAAKAIRSYKLEAARVDPSELANAPPPRARAAHAGAGGP